MASQGCLSLPDWATTAMRCLQREERVVAGWIRSGATQESDGFLSYPWIEADQWPPWSASDLSQGVLARMAEYCAFRLRAFSVELADLNALQQMAEHNLRELGLDLPV